MLRVVAIQPGNDDRSVNEDHGRVYFNSSMKFCRPTFQRGPECDAGRRSTTLVSYEPQSPHRATTRPARRLVQCRKSGESAPESQNIIKIRGGKDVQNFCVGPWFSSVTARAGRFQAGRLLFDEAPTQIDIQVKPISDAQRMSNVGPNSARPFSLELRLTEYSGHPGLLLFASGNFVILEARPKRFE